MALSVYATLGLYGHLAGGLFLLLLVVYASHTEGCVMDAQAQAHAKYLYGDRSKR